MEESIMTDELAKKILINGIPYSIISYAEYLKWVSNKETECIKCLDSYYYDIKTIEDVYIDTEYIEWYSKEEIDKAKLCLFKLVELTRNKIINDDYYKTHTHRGTPSDCERLFSVYKKEIEEILEIIKS